MKCSCKVGVHDSHTVRCGRWILHWSKFSMPLFGKVLQIRVATGSTFLQVLNKFWVSFLSILGMLRSGCTKIRWFCQNSVNHVSNIYFWHRFWKTEPLNHYLFLKKNIWINPNVPGASLVTHCLGFPKSVSSTTDCNSLYFRVRTTASNILPLKKASAPPIFIVEIVNQGSLASPKIDIYMCLPLPFFFHTTNISPVWLVMHPIIIGFTDYN